MRYDEPGPICNSSLYKQTDTDCAAGTAAEPDAGRITDDKEPENCRYHTGRARADCAESIGNIAGLCDGCSPGIIEMYQDYIDGKREMREINAGFHAAYMSGTEGPDRNSCAMGE